MKPWHCTLVAPWRASAKARAALRCLTCLCLSVVCGCVVWVWSCVRVCVCVCVCVCSCSPLPRWVLGASVGWLCVGWLALRHLLQGPSFQKGLEAQGRPASPRVWCVCVCVCVCCAVFCVVCVCGGVCLVVWYLIEKRKGKSIGEAMALHSCRPLESFG